MRKKLFLFFAAFLFVAGFQLSAQTMVVINAYLDALYGEIGQEEALKTLLRNIMPDKLPGQIFFSTNKAADVLIQKGQVELL